MKTKPKHGDFYSLLRISIPNMLDNIRLFIPLLIAIVFILFPSCATNPDQNSQNLARDFTALGKGFYDQGDFARAAELFQRAYELEPTIPGLRYNFARASIGLGNPERGVQLLQEELVQNPQNLLIIEALAFGLQRLGLHEQALDLLLAHNLSSGRSGAYNTAVAFFHTQRYQDGLDWFQTLPDPWIQQDQELKAIGAVLLGLASDPDGAVLILESLPSSVMNPFFRNQLAGFYGKQQRYSQEVFIREQLFQQSILVREQARRLAEIYYQELGDPLQGFQWVQRALTTGLNPQSLENAFREFLSPSEIDELRSFTQSSQDRN